MSTPTKKRTDPLAIIAIASALLQYPLLCLVIPKLLEHRMLPHPVDAIPTDVFLAAYIPLVGIALAAISLLMTRLETISFASIMLSVISIPLNAGWLYLALHPTTLNPN